MATITSTSTQPDIVAAYLDNLSFDTDQSVSKCKAFIEACRALLVMHPQSWSHRNGNMAFNPSLWRDELRRAQAWLSSHQSASTTGGAVVKHLSLVGFRE